MKTKFKIFMLLMLIGWIMLMVLSTMAFIDVNKQLAISVLIIGTGICSGATIFFVKELNHKQFWASQDQLDDEIKRYKIKN